MEFLGAGATLGRLGAGATLGRLGDVVLEEEQRPGKAEEQEVEGASEAEARARALGASTHEDGAAAASSSDVQLEVGSELREVDFEASPAAPAAPPTDASASALPHPRRSFSEPDTARTTARVSRVTFEEAADEAVSDRVGDLAQSPELSSSLPPVPPMPRRYKTSAT